MYCMLIAVYSTYQIVNLSSISEALILILCRHTCLSRHSKTPSMLYVLPTLSVLSTLNGDGINPNTRTVCSTTRVPFVRQHAYRLFDNTRTVCSTTRAPFVRQHAYCLFDNTRTVRFVRLNNTDICITSRQ